MDEAELANQLRLILAEELSDRIPELNQTLLSLERHPDDISLRRELHRLVHVVKGASRSAGVVAVEHACHELETILAETPEGNPLPRAVLEQAIEFVDVVDGSRSAILSPADRATEGGETRDGNVRVAVDDLDNLLARTANIIVGRQAFVEPTRMLGELRAELAGVQSLPTARLAHVTHTLATIYRQLSAAHVAVGAGANALDAQVRLLRLRPVSEASLGCDRIVHDIASRLGKSAAVEIRGTDVKIDRAQVEPLREVLIQLARNAVVHGIEFPDQRRTAGKPELGRITIDTSLDGEVVRVTVRDDGAGIDRAAVGEQARRHGADDLTDAELERAIFSHGVSTAREVTEDAGRGVGLDIAKQRIDALHGSIEVSSVSGRYTQFVITLPTTVATLSTMMVRSGGSFYALATSAVERLVRIDIAAVRETERGGLVRVGQEWLAVAHLGTLLSETTWPQEKVVSAIVLRQGLSRCVLVVDRVERIADVLVSPLSSRVGKPRHIAGQTVMPDGSVALVLDVADILEDALHAPTVAIRPQTNIKRHRVLIADDSITTRALMVNILKTAGYDVVGAVDGQDALEKLRVEPAFDIIVSDIDMPNLDGFGLAQEVRRHERFARLPIVLVTARSSESDRSKGLHAGASAYLVKSGFDQTSLLQTIARLL